MYRYNIWIEKLFIFTLFTWTSSIASTNIFWIRQYVINKTLNLITIIHPAQPFG
jgi:hypothetical protein